jgi:hypothetical protein
MITATGRDNALTCDVNESAGTAELTASREKREAK